VLWIHASNAARFDQSVHEIADRLRLPGHEDPKANHLKLFQRWLENENNGSWLIVLDNADDAGFLLEPPPMASEAQHDRQRIEYFPVSDHGSMIITTRSKDEALRLVFEDDIVSITPMSESEASLLMTSKLGRWEDEIKELVSSLDFMPLAISQAASYIRARGSRWSVQKYREEMEESRKSRTSLLRYEMPLPNRDKYATNSVFLTWQISFEYVNENHRSAADLLSFMSFCDRLAIPELLIRIDGKDGHPGNAASFEEDIVKLRSFSFISETNNTETWEMHRLIQDATQAWLEDRTMVNHAHTHFLSRFSAIFPTGDFEDWPRYRLLFPHAKHALTQQPQNTATILKWSHIMYYSAYFAYEQGDYPTCESMAIASMMARSSQHGKAHESTILAMLMVSKAHWKQGHFSEAEKLETEALELSEAVNGPEHPDTLVALSVSATTYYDQGQWDRAEQLHKKVLEKRQASLGMKHRGTIRSMGNLASVYSALGRLKEAARLQEQALDAYRTVLGANHPTTISMTFNLAVTYRLQGRWLEAEQLAVPGIRVSEAIHGADHPSTLVYKSNLATTRSYQGRYSEAEEIHSQVLDKRKTTLGAEHPSTLTSMSNLVVAYAKQGKYDEAEQLQRILLETKMATLGASHPGMIKTMINSASIYSALGRHSEAEVLELRVIALARQILGAEHPTTLTAMNNLAYTYQRQERWSEAEQLRVEVLKTEKTVLGIEHPSTLLSMHNLASTYMEQDRYPEALLLQEQAVDGYKRVFGKEHPDTETATANLEYIQRMLHEMRVSNSSAAESTRGKEAPSASAGSIPDEHAQETQTFLSSDDRFVETELEAMGGPAVRDTEQEPGICIEAQDEDIKPADRQQTHEKMEDLSSGPQMPSMTATPFAGQEPQGSNTELVIAKQVQNEDRIRDDDGTSPRRRRLRVCWQRVRKGLDRALKKRIQGNAQMYATSHDFSDQRFQI
jgi:tetratricopeptide (TPR) repeat protein